MAEAFVSLAADAEARRTMGERAARDAGERHSLGAAIAAYQRLYDEVRGVRGPASVLISRRTTTQRTTPMSAICGIVGEGAAGGKGRRDVGLMLELLKPRGPDGAPSSMSRPTGGRPFVFGVRQLAVGKMALEPALGRGATRVHLRRSTTARCSTPTSCAPIVARCRPQPAQRGRRGALAHLYELEGPGRPHARRRPVRLRDSGTASATRWCSARPARRAFGLLPRHAGRRDLRARRSRRCSPCPTSPPRSTRSASSHYLTFLTVPGPRTLFKGISKLAAGSTATFDANGASPTSSRTGTCSGMRSRRSTTRASTSTACASSMTPSVTPPHDRAARSRRWSAAATTRAPTRRSWRARSARRAATQDYAAHLHRRAQGARGQSEVQRPRLREAGRRLHRVARTTRS